MFRSLAAPAAKRVTITIDGLPFRALAESTVAASLLEAGFAATGVHPVTQDLRGPYCLMGTCYGCTVSIDGVPGRQGCMVAVRDGMSVVTGLPGTGRSG